jgi:hypothetical protein
MVKDFRFNDIVLYSKGWLRSKNEKDNMIDELGYLFSEIYGFEVSGEKEIARLMLRVIDVLYEEMGIKFDSERNGRFNNSFQSFFNEINNRMWLMSTSLDMAVILWAKSKLFELTLNEIKLNKPHYSKKGHFRIGSLPISATYKEMNKMAKKMFG